MISSQDRSGYFGASDVSYIVGNWKTKTWLDWWQVKQGIKRSNIQTKYTLAGTWIEHNILEHINCPEMDKQIILEDLKLRVNLDGNSFDTIYEVKTYIAEKGYKPPKKHLEQVWVQMYATGYKNAYIVSYGLENEDYINFFRDIEDNRLDFHRVEYNSKWIDEVFLPKITELAEHLKNGTIPKGVIEFWNSQEE